MRCYSITSSARPIPYNAALPKVAQHAFDLRASIEKRGMPVSTALPPPNLDHLQQASWQRSRFCPRCPMVIVLEAIRAIEARVDRRCPTRTSIGVASTLASLR
jgi:hypothetical protein